MANRGIPPMTPCGALAAAAGGAKALGLDGQGIAAAIGVAGSFASGSHEWTITDANCKFTTPGWAARSGVIAAGMARDGFDGSMTAIEGAKGLLAAMAGPKAFDPDAPSAELGSKWHMRAVALKRHPSCQGTQSYIDAALALKRDHQIQADDIADIEITIGAGVGMTLSEPHDMKRAPPTPYAAKFSIPFCVALALTEGDIRLAHFEADWPQARRAGALAAKVRHSVDAAFDVGAADRGRVCITLADGRRLEAERWTSRTVFTIDDVRTKFADCAGWRLDAEQQERVIDALLNLETAADMSAVMPLLSPAAP